MSVQTESTKSTASEQISPKLRHELFLEFFGIEPKELTDRVRCCFIALISRVEPSDYDANDIVYISQMLTDFEQFANECQG